MAPFYGTSRIMGYKIIGYKIMDTYDINVYKSKNGPKRVLILVIAVIVLSAALFAAALYITVENIRADAAAESRALSKQGAQAASEVDLAGTLRASTVDSVLEGETFPSYSVSQIMSLDVSQPSGVTVSDLELVTTGGLSGLEEAFYQAEQDYGINCLFVMAIAAHESANGTICFRPNNMFGYGSSGFSSKAEGIDVVSRALANSYLSPGGSLYSGKTISSVNKRYAASTTWDDKVAANMARYYSTISSHRNAELEKLK